MRSHEFLAEGFDNSVDGVKKNHPEIWEFFKKIGAWMSFERQGKVDMYNTHGQHLVGIKIQPTASIGNLMANLDSAGIKYDAKEEYGMLNGMIPGTDINWSVYVGGQPGNREEQWKFGIPHKDPEQGYYKDRTMEAAGEDPVKAALQGVFNEVQKHTSWEMDIDKLVKAWNYWNGDKALERAKAADFDQVLDMIRHSSDGFKKEPSEDQMSPRQKIIHAVRRINREVDVEEVEDMLGRRANSMTIDEIADAIRNGELGYTGPL